MKEVMNTIKPFMSILIIGLVVIVGGWIVISTISLNNDYKKQTNLFGQKMLERTAFYDNMWKTITQTAKIAAKNDSSFARNINVIMSGRKDGDQVMMKWIKEANPNSNFQEVSKMYQTLQRVVESKRNEFFEQEKMIMDVKLQCDNTLSTIGGGTILRKIFGYKYLQYKPITSDRTDDVIKTGKDNNVDLF
jgi:hypothetical protein